MMVSELKQQCKVKGCTNVDFLIDGRCIAYCHDKHIKGFQECTVQGCTNTGLLPGDGRCMACHCNQSLHEDRHALLLGVSADPVPDNTTNTVPTNGDTTAVARTETDLSVTPNEQQARASAAAAAHSEYNGTSSSGSNSPEQGQGHRGQGGRAMAYHQQQNTTQQNFIPAGYDDASGNFISHGYDDASGVAANSWQHAHQNGFVCAPSNNAQQLPHIQQQLYFFGMNGPGKSNHEPPNFQFYKQHQQQHLQQQHAAIYQTQLPYQQQKQGHLSGEQQLCDRNPLPVPPVPPVPPAQPPPVPLPLPLPLPQPQPYNGQGQTHATALHQGTQQQGVFGNAWAQQQPTANQQIQLQWEPNQAPLQSEQQLHVIRMNQQQQLLVNNRMLPTIPTHSENDAHLLNNDRGAILIRVNHTHGIDNDITKIYRELRPSIRTFFKKIDRRKIIEIVRAFYNCVHENKSENWTELMEEDISFWVEKSKAMKLDGATNRWVITKPNFIDQQGKYVVTEREFKKGNGDSTAFVRASDHCIMTQECKPTVDSAEPGAEVTHSTGKKRKNMPPNKAAYTQIDQVPPSSNWNSDIRDAQPVSPRSDDDLVYKRGPVMGVFRSLTNCKKTEVQIDCCVSCVQEILEEDLSELATGICKAAKQWTERKLPSNGGSGGGGDCGGGGGPGPRGGNNYGGGGAGRSVAPRGGGGDFNGGGRDGGGVFFCGGGGGGVSDSVEFFEAARSSDKDDRNVNQKGKKETSSSGSTPWPQTEDTFAGLSEEMGALSITVDDEGEESITNKGAFPPIQGDGAPIANLRSICGIEEKRYNWKDDSVLQIPKTQKFACSAVRRSSSESSLLRLEHEASADSNIQIGNSLLKASQPAPQEAEEATGMEVKDIHDEQRQQQDVVDSSTLEDVPDSSWVQRNVLDSVIDDLVKERDNYKLQSFTDPNLEKDAKLAYSATLKKFGDIYNKYGNFKEAHSWYEKCLSIRESILGFEHLDVAESYTDLGRTMFERGLYDESTDKFLRALHIRENLLAKDHLDTARTYFHIGRLFQEMGETNESLIMMQKCRVIQEDKLGDHDRETAVTYSYIGLLLGESEIDGGCEQGLVIAEKALNILENTAGNEHPDTAFCFYVKAICLQDTSLEEALIMAEHCCTVQTTALGRRHSSVAKTYMLLGELMRRKGRPRESILQLQQALEIHESIHRDNYIIIARTCAHLSVAAISLGAQQEAKEWHTKVLSTLQESHCKLDQTLVTIYTSAGEENFERGVFGVAAALFRQGVEVMEAMLGKDHPDLADGFKAVGMALHNDGDFAGAQQAYQRCLAVRMATMADDNPEVTETMELIARTTT